MIITELERQRRRRVNVYVNGRFAFSVGLPLAQEKGLYAGQEVTEELLQDLRREDERRRAYEDALRLLSYRPRSEKEMRFRLRRRGIDEGTVEETVRRLRQLHYLDDAAFAQFWAETRDAGRPSARRLVRSELLFKGVDSATASKALEGLDDEDAAYRAASRRLRALAGLPRDAFQKRLGGFLVRRGFSYEVIRRTMERCWDEIGGEKEPFQESSAASEGP